MNILLSIILAVAAVPQGTAPPSGNVMTGQDLYVKHGCYQCHGYSGQNGPGTRLVESARLATAASFITYIRNPQRMPAYSTKVLSDDQLTDIYAYVKTLKASPPLKDIPLLNDLLKELGR